VKLGDLRDQFRSQVDDLSTPYDFSDTEVDDWLNQAVEEAAMRADLLLEVDDARVCEIAVTAGTATYSLHEKITRVTYATFTPAGETTPIKLELIDRDELTRRRPAWRTDEDVPSFLLVEAGKARLAPKPTGDGTLNLEVYRLPMRSMVNDVDKPEIQEKHHRFLADWAEFRAYSKPDGETQDLGRAAAAAARFEHQFGPRPDADMGQAAEAVPHVNKAFW
jgi:hypothetical protein